MVASYFRDTSTIGCILPDARSTVYTPKQEFGHIVGSVSGERFLCIVSQNGISVFATDTPSRAIIDPVHSHHNKKGSIPLIQTSVFEPILSIPLEEIISAHLTTDNRLLFAFSGSGIYVLNLTSKTTPEFVSLVSTKINRGTLMSIESESGELVWIEKSIQRKVMHANYWINSADGTVTMGAKETLHEFKSKSVDTVCMNFMDGLLAIAGDSRILLLSNNLSNSVGGTFSVQSGGEIRDVIPLSGDRVLTGLHDRALPQNGILLVQADVISVYRVLEDEDKLDLVFQFRDAISKLEFLSVSLDTTRPWMIALSAEAFNNRFHLELFDLSQLRPKSVSIVPLMRFDVSRLLNKKDSKDSMVRFINQLSQLPAFVQSTIDETSGRQSSVCILWESVLRDQWFSFMPNFKVLNRNEPYLEREEEFDFNQDADIATIQSTLNRYKKASRELFQFVPNSGETKAGKLEQCQDIVMTEDFKTTYVFPFLSPWKMSPTEGVKMDDPSLDHFGSVFFTSQGPELLSNSR